MNKTFLVLVVLFLCNACGNNDKKDTGPAKDTVKPVRTNTPVTEKPAEAATTTRPAIINMLDSVSPRRIVIYMKDSAKTFDRISLKLGMIYGVKLADVLKKNNLKMASAPIAWYRTQKAPYFFEAGVTVAKRPAKLPKNVLVREMAPDSVVIAHFYGPYSLLNQGYDAVKERLKDQKRTIGGAPYEIYIDDPVDKNGKAVDPYKVRTDIIFPIK